MPKVTIYTRSWCPYCHRALALLESKGVEAEVIDVERTEGALAEMLERSAGAATVPQIFIGERHVGGCDDLVALDRNGRLDPLLEDGESGPGG
ncbi:MAG: glutaredoxin 3 [Acidobacteriota bacterium]|nr:glutaredoxin 3 [Acidobacteriota bacterium]MDQ7087223.1 glutaredoxin 3 [Acidobacteriota bacterium]